MRRRVPPGDGSQLTTTADNFSPQRVNNRHVYFFNCAAFTALQTLLVVMPVFSPLQARWYSWRSHTAK